MRFHPTRPLFRRLLSTRNLPYIIQPRTSFSRRHGITISFPHHDQRRAFFGLSQKPEKEIRKPDLVPGFLTMIELTTRQTMSARPPPIEELLKAFRNFMKSKSRSKTLVTCMEADHVLRTFRYLRDTVKDDDDFGLEMPDLVLARDVMKILPSADRVHLHNEFAKEVFEEIFGRKTKVTPDADMGLHLAKLVKVLTRTGDSLQAREHAERYWALEDSLSDPRVKLDLWKDVYNGFCVEGDEEELLRTFRMTELAKVPFVPYFRAKMVSFYAQKDDVVAAKAWHNKSVELAPSETNPFSMLEYKAILELCIRKNEIEWCRAAFKTLIDSNPNKKGWDLIFQWAASAMGKGVEELDRMMNVMVRRNPDDPSLRPDSATINGLIKMANSQHDPYAAERYVDLGKTWGIKPNAETYILQMEYRISAGDLTGVKASYDKLRSVEIHHHEDVPVINRYIQALCKAKTVNHELVRELVSDLEDRKQHLTGDTVTELCLMNLRRNKLHDVVNALQSNCYHHSLAERERTMDALTEFCCDRSVDTQLVWDAYNILRHLFDEISIATRTRIMNEFFHRKKPNYATHVFGHMRQHPRSNKRPLLSTYVACFSGFALPGCADQECLDTVHNMLKLDPTIEPDTRLRNSLMLAYTASDEPSKAIEFWEDITNSQEGPTYTTLEIVFGACEKLPFGDAPAKSIWAKMRRMEIEVTPSVFAAYVGALAGQGLEQESRELVEGMEADIGVGPDMMTLGTLYNAIPGQQKKDSIEAWARELYADAWNELEAVGQTTTPEGWRLFNIVKKVRA